MHSPYATSYKLHRALVTNSTATAFALKDNVANASKPSGAGIFDLFDLDLGISPGGPRVPKFIQLQPFGTNADNETFYMQVWGWCQIALTENDGAGTATADAGDWVAKLLVEVQVVLGNIDSTVSSTFLADTLTIGNGDANADVISPAGNYSASLILNLRGSELIEFDFDIDAGASNATNANCYWSPYDQQ